jgi:glucose/arabinose dehydrogenase
MANLQVEAGMGPEPVLPAPDPSLIPTVNIAPALGWSSDARPHAGSGLAVSAYAVGLDHPRWLYRLPNGDVLVAETNAPPRPQDRQGIRGFIMGKVMERAGAAVPSANRITLLRDTNGDGVADFKEVFLSGLNSPFGMTLVGSTFYVANTDALVSFPYTDGTTSISAPGTTVTELPAGPLNHHWTKNVIASVDGTRLYVTVGSNSNIAENGIDKDNERAAITEPERILSGNAGELLAMKKQRDGKTLVVVYRESANDGFVISAFLTRREASLNRKKQLWP